MKTRTRFTMRILVVVAMLPLTSGVANAESLKGFLGQQAKTVIQQAQGAASGVGTVDLTHPAQILGQLKSNAQTAGTQVAGQVEQTGLGDGQAVLGAAQAKTAQLQAKIPQN
jgi:hypothetical protein